MTELQNNPDIHDYQESLRVKSTRFRVWAEAFNLIFLRQQIINFIPQISAFFIILCDILENVIKSLKSLHIFESNENSENLNLTIIR